MVKRQKNLKSGSMLAVAIVIIVLLTFAGLAMALVGYNSRVRAIHETAVNTARCAADSGLKECIYLMNYRIRHHQALDAAGQAEVVGVERTVTGVNGTYTLELSGSTSTGFAMTATGKFGSGDRAVERKVHARLERKTYWWGLGVENGINLKTMTAVGTLPGGTGLEVRTNSTAKDAITLNTAVTGDIVFGPDGNVGTVVKLLPHADVSGSIYPAEEKIVFPPVSEPTGAEFATLQPTITGGSISASGKYAGINLGTGATVTVTGNVTLYITGQSNLGNSASIVVSPGSSLMLYLGGNLIEGNAASLVNQTNVAANLRVYGLPTCTQIDIKNTGDLYAAVYAPQAAVTIYNDAKIVGSIIGNSLESKNGGSFYYDMSLVDIQDPESMYIKATRWWEE
jgi:hypothetical protein